MVDVQQRSPSVKDKLDSVLARLDRLCSGDGDNALQGDDEHERWGMLFELVVAINYDPQLC